MISAGNDDNLLCRQDAHRGQAGQVQTRVCIGKQNVQRSIDELLDQVLDKWSLLVMEELCDRPSRFNELRSAIPAVTAKSLSAQMVRLLDRVTSKEAGK